MQFTKSELIILAMALDDVKGTPGYRSELVSKALAALRAKIEEIHKTTPTAR